MLIAMMGEALTDDERVIFTRHEAGRVYVRGGCESRRRPSCEKRKAPVIIPWLHRRREATRLANADAAALIREHGGAALLGSSPARARRDPARRHDASGPHSRSLAARRTATRMLMARDPPPPAEMTDPDTDAEVDRLLGR